MLDISYNNLRSINFETFLPYLKHLSELYLDGNGLTVLDGLSNQTFPELRTVGLSRNRFRCPYILKIIMSFDLDKIELTVDSNDTSIDKTHVNGIACEHLDAEEKDWSRVNIRLVSDHHGSEALSPELNQSLIMQLRILETQHRYSILSLQEQIHSFYLNFIKNLIVIAAAFGSGATFYKFVVFHRRQQRDQFVVNGSFRNSLTTTLSNATDVEQ